VVCGPCRVLRFSEWPLCYKRLSDVSIKDLWNVNKFGSILFYSQTSGLEMAGGGELLLVDYVVRNDRV
jgi:hypothetical protein